MTVLVDVKEYRRLIDSLFMKVTQNDVYIFAF